MSPDFAGCSPLATSVINGHLDMVMWLVNKTPCDVNITDNMAFYHWTIMIDVSLLRQDDSNSAHGYFITARSMLRLFP